MSRQANVFVSIRGTKGYETAKAVHFTVHEISGEPVIPAKAHWFPFSHVEKMTTDSNSVEQDTMLVTEWILKAKELI